ncbi:MAG: type II toxin-antitoxin system RelB/DinJ family antitoxin [Firmicutes bacterium]|nr:type II toxin-antitoxin system RelB/DinJ family antitoxin [Bacillota bacterium]
MSVTLEVKMEKKLKEAAESIYNEIGISLDEAVRLFVMKSVEEGKMPFKTDTKKKSIMGILSKYADADKIPMEEGAYERAMIEKYEKKN